MIGLDPARQDKTRFLIHPYWPVPAKAGGSLATPLDRRPSGVFSCASTMLSHQERAARRKRIVDEIVRGDSVQEVANRHGVSFGFVRNVCASNCKGILRQRRNHELRQGVDRSRHRLAAKLHSEGMTFEEIGRRLGVTRERVRQLVHKAHGNVAVGIARRHEIREKRLPTIQDVLRQAASNRHWSKEKIIAALQRFASQHNRAPGAHEWLTKRPAGCPSVHTVQRYFGTWAAGLAAAGLTSNPHGSASHRSRTHRS